MSETIDNGAEYGLYALALRDPQAFREVEQFTGGMLANEPRAALRAKAVVAGAVQRADGSLTKKLATTLADRGILPGRNPDGVNDDLEKLLHLTDEALERVVSLESMLKRIEVHGASGVWDSQSCAIGACAALRGDEQVRAFMKRLEEGDRPSDPAIVQIERAVAAVDAAVGQMSALIANIVSPTKETP